MKWWYWTILGFACVLVVGGSLQLASPRADTPEFSEEEVVAIVKSNLLKHGYGGRTVISVSIDGASYVKEGKWSGICAVEYERERRSSGSIRLARGRDGLVEGPIPEGGTTTRPTVSIRWHFFEKSRTVEVFEAED